MVTVSNGMDLKGVLLQRAGTIGFNERIATANGSGELFDLSARQPWGNSCGKKLTQIKELNQVGVRLRRKRHGLFSSYPLSKYRVLCLFYVLLRLNAWCYAVMYE